MNNKFILIAVVIVIIAAGGFYFIKNSDKPAVSNNPVVDNNSVVNETTPKAENNSDKDAFGICDIFPKEEIASITGLNITSAKVFTMGENIKNSNCGYYIDGKTVAAALSIGLYEGDVSPEKAKYADERLFNGWRVLTDNQIPMEHFITYNEVQQLNDIYLIAGPDKFYRIALFSLSALKSQQMIELTIQVVAKVSQ